MSDSNKSNRDNYSRFDNMSTEELEEILRLDFQLPDDEESDMDAILYITEVIEKREKEHPTGRFTDVQTSWASFKENYLPYAEDSKSLYDFEDTEIQAGFTKTPFEKFLHPQRKRKTKRFAGIAATLIVILLTGTLTANAFGFDLWGAVATWTKDTFGFSTLSSRETMPESLQKTLEKYEITSELVPTWFPEGYSLEDVEVNETPLKTTFNATYKSIDDEISIIIVALSEPLTKTYEKDSDDVTVYTVNSIEHYIMTNLERISYWTHNFAAINYLGELIINMGQATKNSTPVYIADIDAAIARLESRGVINTSSYWTANYSRLLYLEELIINVAKRLL